MSNWDKRYIEPVKLLVDILARKQRGRPRNDGHGLLPSIYRHRLACHAGE
jgi:hypothetical protein